jgi:hypothetical protein
MRSQCRSVIYAINIFFIPDTMLVSNNGLFCVLLWIVNCVSDAYKHCRGIKVLHLVA